MKNALTLLMEKIADAPVWVQEVIYYDIKKRLTEKLPSVDLTYTDFEIYPAFVPKLTFKGRQELEQRNMNLDFNVYKYLSAASDELRVIDITLNNFWTLEESSRYLATCLTNELIVQPDDTIMCAAIYYIAGEIRIGEYVKRINKINVEELDDVLRKQKQHNVEHPNEQIKTGELMINMGYIANMDIAKILYTKDEAKKRFIFSGLESNSQSTEQNNDRLFELESVNKKLLDENKLLKDKLRQIFNIQNKSK